MNFHVMRACDARGRFRLATFHDDRRSSRRLTRRASSGSRATVVRLGFARGEPTVHPDIGGLARFAGGVSRFDGCSGRIGSEEP